MQAIEGKPAYRFIAFDEHVVEYYPSITEELLNKALDFASQFDTITEKERDIIVHAKTPACIPTGLHGENPANKTYSMSRWVAGTAPKLANYSVNTCYH